MDHCTYTTNPPAIYHGTIMHMLDSETVVLFSDGALVVNENGCIDTCCEWTELEKVKEKHYSLYPVIHLPESTLIIPGFTDLHTHLPQWHAIGHEEATLQSWLNTAIFPAEIEFSSTKVASTVAESFLTHLLASGTTTAALFLTVHVAATEIIFQTAAQKGLRLIAGQNLMDCNAPEALLGNTDVLLQQTEQLCQKWDGYNQGQLSYAWMPRFAITASSKLLQGIGALCKQYPNVYCHTHLSEQPSEIETVLKQFSWAKHYTDVYDQFGLLHSRTILAHSIHLSPQEFTLLRNRGSVIAHCPSSNFFLKSGQFNINAIEQNQIPYGLGSDIAAGPDLCMLKVMQAAQYRQDKYWFSPKQLFYQATLGGAKAVQLDKITGNFQSEKSADFVILNLKNKPGLILSESIPQQEKAKILISKLIHLGDERLVEATIMRGLCRWSSSKK